MATSVGATSSSPVKRSVSLECHFVLRNASSLNRRLEHVDDAVQLAKKLSSKKPTMRAVDHAAANVSASLLDDTFGDTLQLNIVHLENLAGVYRRILFDAVHRKAHYLPPYARVSSRKSRGKKLAALASGTQPRSFTTTTTSRHSQVDEKLLLVLPELSALEIAEFPNKRFEQRNLKYANPIDRGTMNCHAHEAKVCLIAHIMSAEDRQLCHQDNHYTTSAV